VHTYRARGSRVEWRDVDGYECTRASGATVYKRVAHECTISQSVDGIGMCRICDFVN